MVYVYAIESIYCVGKERDERDRRREMGQAYEMSLRANKIKMIWLWHTTWANS